MRSLRGFKMEKDDKILFLGGCILKITLLGVDIIKCFNIKDLYLLQISKIMRLENKKEHSTILIKLLDDLSLFKLKHKYH